MLQLIGITAALGLTAELSAQPLTDEAAIGQLVQDMAASWTAGDGPAFARHFAEEHDYIVWNGYYMPGMNPRANGAAHQQLFDTAYRNTQMFFTLDKVKFIRPELALIHVLGAMSKQGEPRPEHPAVLWTALLERQAGGWKIISFHNSDLEMFRDEATRQRAPLPAEQMYASWYRE